MDVRVEMGTSHALQCIATQFRSNARHEHAAGNAKGRSQEPALWLKPREEPPPVLLLGICCWLFVPMRHGFLNLVSP